MNWKIGDTVKAAERITEEDFNGSDLWVHAEQGDRGTIVSLPSDPEWYDVRFSRTGTLTVCHASELA